MTDFRGIAVAIMVGFAPVSALMGGGVVALVVTHCAGIKNISFLPLELGGESIILSSFGLFISLLHAKRKQPRRDLAILFSLVSTLAFLWAFAVVGASRGV
jgi:hypothetical protein